MKVLFIGEGRGDIGAAGDDRFHPRVAQGTIPSLSRRLCPSISEESIALQWRESQRFNPAAKKSGYQAKVPAAVLVATKYECQGSVVVTDRDGNADRYGLLEDGVQRAKKVQADHRIAFGLAIESVEAWTLAAPDALAEELGVEPHAVQDLYPKGKPVEDLRERSGKEEHQPKRLLQRIAQLAHRDDSTDFRQSVAERTDPVALEKACPLGFKPFADQLRACFGTEGDEQD